jgi:hypothetical protein
MGVLSAETAVIEKSGSEFKKNLKLIFKFVFIYKNRKKKNTRSLKTPFETIKQPPIPLKIIK